MSTGPPRKRPSESATYLSEILGDESRAGAILPTGSILEMMDLVAGRVAWVHSGGRVATVSLDRVDLFTPFANMDMVKVDGELVSVGSSSMLVQVKVYKHDIHTRQDVVAAWSYVTMVAIDDAMRPRKDIPKLLFDDKAREDEAAELAAHRKVMTTRWVEMHKQVDQLVGNLRLADVEEDSNKPPRKREHLSIAQSLIVIRKQSLPRHLNYNATVFGGDILKWMEQAATFCARRFTGNTHALTISMNRVSFKQPLTNLDLVDMRASVVYVRTFVLEVEVLVQLDRPSLEKPVSSHTGYFTILNIDQLGFKRPIMVGVKLDEKDQQELCRAEKARRRFYFARDVESRGHPAVPKGAGDHGPQDDQFRSFWMSS